MSTVTSKIKERIEKLWKKAESAGEIGSLEEAQAFMAKAQELLAQYNLELSDVIRDIDKNPCEKYGVDLINTHGWTKTDGDWLVKLYYTLAKFNFCKSISSGANDSKHQVVYLVGEEHNVDTVLYMAGVLVPKIKKLRLQRWNQYGRHTHEKQNAFKRGYFQGAVNGLYTRLQEQREQDVVVHVKMTDLVVLTDKLIDEATAEFFGKLRTTKSSRLSAINGAALGHKDGRNLEVRKGISEKLLRLN